MDELAISRLASPTQIIRCVGRGKSHFCLLMSLKKVFKKETEVRPIVRLVKEKIDSGLTLDQLLVGL